MHGGFVELRSGYKQTDVGVIPEDWQLRPVGSMGEVLTGKALAVNAPGEQRPYLRTKNVFDGRIDVDDVLTMPMTDAQFSHFMLMIGDVLLNEGQSLNLVGRCALYHGEYPEPCAIQNQLLRFRANPGVSASFASHLFRYCQQTGVFARIALQTTSIAHLGGKRFEQLILLWPLEAEQRAIAAALSDVDALLEGLTRLIAKKRDLKQAAMQQLLTGRTRLPGFHGKWVVKRLEEVGDIRSGGTPSTAQAHFWNGDIPWCTPTDITGLHGGKYLTETARTISAAGLQFSSAEVIPPRSLIMTSRATIGECAINLIPTTTNQGFKNIVPFAELNVDFLYYMMITQKNGLIALCGGSTFLEIGKKQLSAYTINLPRDQDEQTAIAAAISDMDAELSALKARRDKTRALKQAMMQELLTGRTRLVVPAVTENRKDSERRNGQRANIHFKRSVLAAEIIDRLHGEPTFGHVKFEKMIFLVEHLCDVDTGSAYHRDAAGPYDNRAIRSIDSQLRKQKWFDAQKIDDRYRYEPLANRGRHKEYFERYFGGIGTAFDTVIETFRTFTTERCEIVATLFAAWRDLLQQDGPVSDDMIVNEVLNNWHESKKRIPEERWRKALSWMRDNGFVPREAIGA